MESQRLNVSVLINLHQDIKMVNNVAIKALKYNETTGEKSIYIYIYMCVCVCACVCVYIQRMIT